MIDLDQPFLHVSPSYHFSGRSVAYRNARYVVVGVPYDRTSTYRTGSRFAPLAIREASLNIETYSMRTGVDVENLAIFDAGDLHVTDNPEETIERINDVTKQIISDEKIPVLLGGEHSISLGGVRAFADNTTVVDFDAHMDLRNEYGGERLSHAAVMRRISEYLGPHNIVQIGTRAVCKEEVEFSDRNHMSRITALDLNEKGIENSRRVLRGALGKSSQIYVSIDMDVLDPAYAPAVGNPEGDGISPNTLLSFLGEIRGKEVVAIDLTEITPHYDTGGTAVQAARILFELLCHVELGKNKSP